MYSLLPKWTTRANLKEVTEDHASLFSSDEHGHMANTIVCVHQSPDIHEIPLIYILAEDTWNYVMQ